MKKITVGVLGATGVVGQNYLSLLANHPWFEVTFLASSQRSANQPYGKAVQGRWKQEGLLPKQLENIIVSSIDDIDKAANTCQMIFSAVGSDIAEEYERRYAQAGLAVVSNASYHRRDSDVPMIIPEINPDHLQIIPKQQHKRGWNKGYIAVKPNCSLQSYLIPLWPIHQRYGIEQVIVTTLQAISGAGYPGVSSMDILGNVVPYIGGEEEKSEWEPLKILGTIQGDSIVNAHNIAIAAHCNRVPVYDGHLACVSVKVREKASAEEIITLWNNFTGEPQRLALPSAPSQPILYLPEVNRPQPLLDRNAGNGMAVTVGRLRPCPVLDFRFVGLSHNTVRGAAGGGVLIAELLAKQQFLQE